MNIFGWLAQLGTPKPLIVAQEASKGGLNLPRFYSKPPPTVADVQVFKLTADEIADRNEWCKMMAASDYIFKYLSKLPKHFKIGSVIFLLDNLGTSEKYYYSTCILYHHRWYIKSYIDGRPEPDNGDCTVTKEYERGRYANAEPWYIVSNNDLLSYIMNNLDKIVSCEADHLNHLGKEN